MHAVFILSIFSVRRLRIASRERKLFCACARWQGHRTRRGSARAGAKMSAKFIWTLGFKQVNALVAQRENATQHSRSGTPSSSWWWHNSFAEQSVRSNIRCAAWRKRKPKSWVRYIQLINWNIFVLNICICIYVAMCWCIHVPLYFCITLSMYQCISVSTYQWYQCINQFLSRFLFVSMSIYMHVSINLFTHIHITQAHTHSDTHTHH